MTLEELMALGLTKEQAEKALEAHKKSLVNDFIPKSRFDEVNAELKGSKETLKERDAQIATLKTFEGTNAELQKKVEELAATNAVKEQEMQAALQKERLTAAMKMALNEKVHDADLVLGLIDSTKVTMQDGKLVGFEDLLSPLKETKKFLFKDETQSKQEEKPNLSFEGLSIKGLVPPDDASKKDAEVNSGEALGKALAASRKKAMETASKSSESYFGGGV